MIFLIDTGSDIWLIPASKQVMSTRPSDVKLFAANNTHVLTFSEKRLTLNLGLRRSCTWNFCVAEVPDPIIGADLLTHYHLVSFLHQLSLIDTSTGRSTTYSAGRRGVSQDKKWSSKRCSSCSSRRQR